LISAVQLLDSIEETSENDETGEDDKVGEFEKFVWVPGELKSGVGYTGTLVRFSLPTTGASVRLPRYSGQP
jgi:hypothetical protein